MKERTFVIPDDGDAIMRDHSPYCESKGPIIQEGFVAQRIRALQELQAHALAGNRSHSPLIPCPPRWVRSYEPLSPPRAALPTQPPVKVPIMSDYGAIKHHWASMVRGARDDMIGWPNLSAATHSAARRTQQSDEPHEPHSEGIDPSDNTSPRSEHFQKYQPYIRPTKSTGCIDITMEKPAESQVIKLEEPHAAPTYTTEPIRPTIEQSADSQKGMQDKLRTTLIKTTQCNGSAIVVPYNWQKIDRDEPQNGVTRNTRSVGSTSETLGSSQQIEPYEAHTTSNTSSQANGLGVGEHASSETAELNESLSPNFRTSLKSEDKIQPPPRINTPTSSEREILGPNPVSAGLADPSVLSRCISPRKPQDSDPNNNYKHEQILHQPHKSVADKLGLLVERGWVGCDVFGRAYNQNADSGSLMTTSHIDGDRADSQCISSDQGPRLSEAQIFDVRSRKWSTNGGSESHRFVEHDTSHMGKTTSINLSGLGRPLPRSFEGSEMHRSPEVFPLERRSSHIASGSVKTSVSSPTSKRRVFSLQQLYRLRRSNSEGIELRSFSQGSTANSTHDSVSPKLSSQEKVSSKWYPKDIMAGHEEEQISCASASLAPRSRRSSISRNEYIRSSSRSTSWFRKSWLKTLLGDGKSMHEEDPLKNHSSSASASVSTGSAKRDPPSRSRHLRSRDTGITHMLAEPVQRGESDDASASTTVDVVAKEHKDQDPRTVTTSIDDDDLPLKRHGQQTALRLPTVSDPTPVPPFLAVSHESLIETLREHCHKHAQKSSGQSEKSMTSLPNLLPSRASSKSPATASKSASFISKSSENSLHSPQGKSSRIPQTPRKLSPTSSTSISVRIHRSSKISPVPLVYASGGPRAVSTAEQLQEQAHDEEAAHGGLGRGRALKKIQVIISFDGAEDLIIEADAGGDAVQGSWKP